MQNDTHLTRIALTDGPTIDVEQIAEHVEVTLTCAGRARAGIALSTTETRELAAALTASTATVDPFTSTFPGDDDTPLPAVPYRTFASVPGHREALGVTAIAEPDGTQVHVGGAVLSLDAARDLIAHLTGIVEATR